MSQKHSVLEMDLIAVGAGIIGMYTAPCLAVILATQRPDVKVITGRLKVNVTNILGLRALDKTNSRVIIDHDGLERLRGKGHGIFKRGADEITVQCPYLSANHAKELIAPYRKAPETPKIKTISDFDFMEDFKNANRTRSKGH